MKLIYSIIFLNFISIVVSIPEINHFFIEENKDRCALIDLSADITVSYNTTQGITSTVLNFINSTNNQTGKCSSNNLSDVQFNITIPPSEILSLKFSNMNNFIYLSFASFVYSSSDINFPNSTETGTSVAVYNKTMYLSNIKNNFQCNSTLELNMIKGVTLKIYYIKAKVYQVKNTFSNDSDRCPQDYSNSTTVPPTLSTTQTTIPITNTSMKPTETTVTTGTKTTSTKSTETTSTRNTETTSTRHTETTSTRNTETTSTRNTETTSTKSTRETTTKSTRETTTKSITTASVISTSHKSSSSTTKPDPSDDWLFSVNDNGTVCLLLRCHININGEEFINKQEIKLSFDNLSNKNTTSYGNCSNTEDRIVIIKDSLSLQIDFQKSDNTFNLHRVSLYYHTSNATFNNSITFNHEYETKMDTSYTCNSVSMKISNFTVNLSDLRFEAFRKTKTLTFSSTETSCSNPNKNPLVAIIVGVVLAAFLIIVVIIFLIMRYRAHKLKGYEEI